MAVCGGVGAWAPGAGGGAGDGFVTGLGAGVCEGGAYEFADGSVGEYGVGGGWDTDLQDEMDF